MMMRRNDNNNSGTTDDKEEFPVYELIAQELLRLFIPRQPKTRLVYDEKNDCEYVMSKQVSGYRSLETVSREELKQGIKTGKYTGLGEIQIMALFLNEIDLKFDNMCLNDLNQIVKIDGDRCFAQINGFQSAKYAITEKDITALPFIKDYYAYNWLDLIEYEMMAKDIYLPIKKTSRSLDIEMVSNAGFRAEINKTMFKIMMMPDQLLADFIACYPVTDSQLADLYEELIERKEQIAHAATRNQSFCEFISGMEAVNVAHDFVEELRSFHTMGKHQLPMKRHESTIVQNYLDLRAKVANEIKPRRSSRLKYTLFAEQEKPRSDNEVKARKRRTLS